MKTVRKKMINPRVVIQQPSLARYRVGLFAKLSDALQGNFFLAFGKRRGIQNAAPSGFAASEEVLRHFRVGPLHAFVHPSQWRYASLKQCDILVLVWNVHYLLLVPALIRARLGGVKTILWGHGYSKRESYFRKHLRFAVTHLADATLFYDPKTRDTCVSSGWIRETKAFYAMNAIDHIPIVLASEKLEEDASALDAFAATHGLHQGQTLLFVSRLHRSNCLDVAIRAVGVLKEVFSSIKLLIVGDGDSEQERLTALACELGVADRIVFLGRIDDEVELCKCFKIASVFCYPENIGLSLLHSLHYGLPVVTGADMGLQNPEICVFRPGLDGLLFKNGDHLDMASKISELINDVSRRERMSSEIKMRALSEITLDKMSAGFLKAFQAVLR